MNTLETVKINGRIKYKVECDFCKKEIYKTAYEMKRAKYNCCDRKCADEMRKLSTLLKKQDPSYQPPQRKKYKRTKHKCFCSYCGKETYKTTGEINRAKNLYCGRECFHKAVAITNRKEKVSVNCAYCNKKFDILESQTKGKQSLYCSKKCRGIHFGVLHRGENHFRFNPNFDRETNRKYQEYYDWRNQVYERDNYTCQCCGDKRGGNLIAHHIYNYSEHENLRTNVDNGITLCKKCHKDFHDTFGYTNNNKEQLEIYLNMPINYHCI